MPSEEADLRAQLNKKSIVALKDKILIEERWLSILISHTKEETLIYHFNNSNNKSIQIVRCIQVSLSSA